MKTEDVVKAIKSTFSKVTLGDGIGLWEAQAIDDYESEQVQRESREKDEKEDWSSLGWEELQRCHSSLSFFDADGMRFHLPAFILASMENKVEDPLFHLTQLTDYSRTRFASLNNEQRQAIIMYLKWCLEQEDYELDRQAIEMALKEYWET